MPVSTRFFSSFFFNLPPLRTHTYTSISISKLHYAELFYLHFVSTKWHIHSQTDTRRAKQNNKQREKRKKNIVFTKILSPRRMRFFYFNSSMLLVRFNFSFLLFSICSSVCLSLSHYMYCMRWWAERQSGSARAFISKRLPLLFVYNYLLFFAVCAFQIYVTFARFYVFFSTSLAVPLTLSSFPIKICFSKRK